MRLALAACGLIAAAAVLASPAHALSTDGCPCTAFPATMTPTLTGLSTTNGRSGSGPFSLELGLKFTVDAPSKLIAVRFYKDAAETGSHTATVWSTQGVPLAHAVFTTETPSGWQEQALATPLSLAPGAVYTVSIGVNSFFVQTRGGLASEVVSGPIHTVADGTNGDFAEAAGVFPTEFFDSSNYFVDAKVVADNPPHAPTATTLSPAPGATGVAQSATVSAQFSSALDAATVTPANVTLTGPGAVPGTVSYDSGTSTVSFAPSSSLAPSTAYTLRIGTGVHGADGTPLADVVQWTFTTAGGSGGGCPCSIFPSTLAPSLTGLSTANGRTGPGPFTLEVGTKFAVDSPQRLRSIRFWKDGAETGLHTGRVWTSTGILLESVDFAAESASGWQQQELPTPIALQPGVVYMVSVNVNSRFVQTPGGLASQVTSGPVHSIADGTNGDFADSAGTFPSSFFASSNYFVDVVVDGVGAPAAAAVYVTSPANGALAVPTNTSVSASFSVPSLGGSTGTFQLLRPDGTAVPSTSTYDGSTGTATLTPLAPLAQGTWYTAVVDSTTAGLTVEARWKFVTINVPPTITAKSPADGATAVPTSSAVTATFSRAMDPATLTSSTFTLVAADGTAIAAGVSYDAGSSTATLTPLAPLLTSTTYTARLDGSVRAADTARLDTAFSWSFTTAPGAAVRINSGGGAYTTKDGRTFLADQYFTGGSVFASGNTVQGSPDAGLYQDERYGAFSYSIPVANGVYDVRLHFVEQYFVNGNCEGKRIFDVDIVDSPNPADVSDLDICSLVGSRFALVRVIQGVTVRDGTLDLRGIPGPADDPELAAVEVVPAGTGGDADPPTAPGTLTATGTLGKVSLSWDPASDNTGVTDYDIYRSTTPGFSATFSKRIAQVDGTQTTYVDQGIGGTYYYLVRAEDATGNQGPVSNQATGVAAVDTTAPSIPANVAANVISGGATVSWSASTDDWGPVKYAVYRSTVSGFAPSPSTKIGQTAGTSFNDPGLPTGTYYYVVTAFDGAGNTSAPSSQVSATITSDTTPPTVSLTAPANGAAVSGWRTITASATDAGGVAGVQFKLDGANLNAEVTAKPWSTSWDTTLTTPGTHTLTAVARDTSGNMATSASITVTVSNTLPAPGTGLVASYGFDAGSGTTVADVSGNGNTGTIANATWTAGHSGGALAFNGANAMVTVPDAPILGLTTGMTLEAWVDPTTLGKVFHTVLLKEYGTNELAYALYASNASGNPDGEIYIAAQNAVKAASALPLAAWTHLAETYDGTTLRLYVNGNLVASKGFSGAIKTTSNDLRIGGNSVWGEWFSGSIDDVRVYNRPLFGAEIRADMATPVSG